jgi:glycosyltransferase involved in cell wall biosynthesis
MNIVIAAVAASPHISGVSRHAANLARCLLANADVSDVHLVVAEWQVDSIKSVLPTDDVRLQLQTVSVGRSALSRNLWFYRKLPVLAARLEADIVHLAYPVPLNRNAFHCPTVVTLHDLYPYDIPENFGFPKVFFNRIILQQCLKSVDAISCVSDSTRRALAIHASSAISEKAVTIYNCVEQPPIMAKNGPIPAWSGEPFLLCVAQHRRNKNVVLAIQVFKKLLLSGEILAQTRLVVIGITGPETTRIRQFIQESGLADGVVLLQGVDDAELQWCYGHCQLLLAPSLVEGFGLPVVEGMFHRCRIVCSDIPAFREIGGSYCHYAWLGPEAEQAFSDAARFALIRVRSRAPATERFSGAVVAEASLQLYTRLCKAHPVSREHGYHISIPPLRKGQS